jgi:hypothetical protein
MKMELNTNMELIIGIVGSYPTDKAKRDMKSLLGPTHALYSVSSGDSLANCQCGKAITTLFYQYPLDS